MKRTGLKCRLLGYIFLIFSSLVVAAEDSKNSLPDHKKIDVTNQQAAAKDAIFVASFDRYSADADISAGSPKSSLDASLELRGQSGIKGNALLLEPGEKAEYDAAGNFHPLEGTISFWVKPLNWTGDDILRRTFFSILLPTCSLVIGKPNDRRQSARFYIEVNSEDGPRGTFIVDVPVAWDLSEWVRLDATWNRSKMKLYVNGRLGTERQLPSNFHMPEYLAQSKFLLVPLAKQISRIENPMDRTVIDEVKIYPYALNEEEIQAEYLKLAPEEHVTSDPKKFSSIALKFVPFPEGKTLRVFAEMRDIEKGKISVSPEKPAELHVTVSHPSGPNTERSIPVLGPSVDFKMDDFPFMPGSHRFKAVLQQGQWQSDPSEEVIDQPTMSWIGAHAGVTHEVLSPWTPLEKVSDRKVRCWGRDYEFDGPFLHSVSSQGVQLLREPMKLIAHLNGKEYPFFEDKRTCVSEAPDRIEFQGEGQLKGLPVRINWKSWIEYDGAVWSHIELETDSDQEIDGLSLEVPLIKALGKYIRFPVRAESGVDDPHSDQPFESSFCPVMWMFDDMRGFTLFTESEANWVYTSGRKPIHITRGENPSMLLSLIGKRVLLPRKVEYQIGFEATPVKPMLPDWRERNFGNVPTLPFQTEKPYNNGYAWRRGLWIPEDADNMMKHYRALKKSGVNEYFYATTGVVPNENAEYKFFANRWFNTYGPQFGPFTSSKVPDDASAEKVSYFMMPNNAGDKAFIDFQTWLAEKMVKDYQVPGLYTDVDGLTRTENDMSGCFYLDAFGKKGAIYPILARRDFAKRIAAIVREGSSLQGRAWWMAHCHSNFVAPIHGFADFMYPGEQFSGKIFGNPWVYITIPDWEWPYNFSGKPGGLPYILLSQLRRGTKDPKDIATPEYSEALLAMAAVNDVSVGSANMNAEAMSEWWKLREKMKFNQAKFTHFNDSNCPVKCETPNALASVYAWPDYVCIAIANKEKDARPIEITINRSRLEIPEIMTLGFDLRTSKTLQITTDKISIPVAGRNYTFVLIPKTDQSAQYWSHK